MHGKNMKLFGK